MSFWANVLLGKCRLGKCLSGQMSFWANVFWANVVWANVFLAPPQSFELTVKREVVATERLRYIISNMP
jgi:hypothetical protein